MNFNQDLDLLRQQMLKLPLNEFWQVGEEAGLYLSELVSSLNPKKLLEIGTSCGYSTTWLLQGLQQKEAHLITIESNKNRFEISQKYLETLNLGQTKLTQIRHHAPEVFEEIDLHNVDFVFCDAIKKQTLDLYLYLKPFLGEKGVFVVDNVISHKDSMQNFYDYLDQNNISYKLIKKGSGLIQISAL